MADAGVTFTWWVEMLVGAGYVIQQLGVGYATDMEHANPNKVAIVEAWGNLQKGLEGQGVLVFIGHGTRRRDIGPLCLLLAVPEEYVRNAEEYVCVADDLPRHISLDNDNEPLLSLAAICCHSGAPPPQPRGPESSLEMTFLDSSAGREAGMFEAGLGPVGNQPSMRHPFDIDICVAPHHDTAKAIHTCWKESNGTCFNKDVAVAVAQVEGCSAPDVHFETGDHGARLFLQ